MFKFSDIKVGDILVANDSRGGEYKVLEAAKQENIYYFYIENLQTKVRSRLHVYEGNENKFGLAKIVHA